MKQGFILDTSQNGDELFFPVPRLLIGLLERFKMSFSFSSSCFITNVLLFYCQWCVSLVCFIRACALPIISSSFLHSIPSFASCSFYFPFSQWQTSMCVQISSSLQMFPRMMLVTKTHAGFFLFWHSSNNHKKTWGSFIVRTGGEEVF